MELHFQRDLQTIISSIFFNTILIFQFKNSALRTQSKIKTTPLVSLNYATNQVINSLLTQ